MLIERTVEIDAPVEVVWTVMSDVARWPTWTESIRSVEVVGDGDFGKGSTAKVRQPGFPAATWEVTDWRPGLSFTWTARVPGLTSTGVHSVEPTGPGSSRATLTFSQDGWMAGMMGLIAGARSRRYVDLEANGLKARCETAPPGETALPG